MRGLLKYFLGLSFILALALELSAQETPTRMQLALPYSGRQELTSISSTVPFDYISGDTAYFETYAEDAVALASRFPGSVLSPAAVQLTESDMAASLEEARSFTKYPTLEQYIQLMQDFASTYPSICLLDTIGFSTRSRPVLVLKISDNVNVDEEEPRFMYSSTIHGDEILGYVLLLRLADTLLSSYGNSSYLTNLVNETEIWINPLANPDGAYYLSDTSLVGSRRYNDHGVDLNRNFPDPASSDLVDDYSGRETETIGMMDFLMEHRFSMSANLHGGAEVVNYPWDYKYALHPDDDWLYFISREYADEVHAEEASYMDDFPDGVTNGADWYVVYGGRQDYVTYYLEGRELTIELSNTKLLPSSLLDLYWRYNDYSLVNLMQQARYGIHGLITEKGSGKPVSASITVQNHDDASSIITSDPLSGRFYRYLKEGSYNLKISADGYKDTLVESFTVTDYQASELLIELDTVLTSVLTGDMAALRLYPDPCNEFLQLESNGLWEEGSEIQVFGSDGRKYIEMRVEDPTTVFILNVSGLREGLYFIRVQSGSGILAGRFVKTGR